MKISQMLVREDFYSINRNTLKEYFKDCDGNCKLYIYPHLNAIITAKPSRNVKNYLYREYSVRGSFVKSFLVKCYVKLCLNSCGFFASNTVILPNNMNSDMLIYPCNKKYRIFDFSKGTVDVIIKSGFPKNDLENEIKFRTENNGDFIPKLIFCDNNGYRENIIEGMPVARLKDDYEKIRKKAISTIESYAEKNDKVHSIVAREYIDTLAKKITNFTLKTSKQLNTALLIKILNRLLDMTDKCAFVELTLSHGDLQSGNIWIDKTGKLYIIDWESWGERSIWYDRAVLFDNIHTGGLEEFIIKNGNKTEVSIVCLEDMIFRLNEMFNLPFDYGEKSFEDYLKLIERLIFN